MDSKPHERPVVDAERLRNPERGMLTALGAPLESALIDRSAYAKAWDRACEQFAAAGIHLFFPHIPLTECWLGDGRYDFAPLDAAVRRTLDRDPSAQLILRLRLHTPPWWLDAHPDQILLYADGSDFVDVHWAMTVRSPSVASTIWRQDVQKVLAAAVAHVRASPYASHVVGFHPALMHGGEWFEEGALDGKRADYSPVMERAFREYLTEKFPGEGWPERVVPTSEERGRGDIGHLRDPQRSRRIIEYYRFFSDLIAEHAEECCRTIKTATGGRAITGVYYGYTLIFGMSGDKDWAHTMGHLALKRILDSPHIDYVGSMLEYHFRFPGGFPWSFGPLADSARAHGKVYVGEDEARTWLNPRYPEVFGYIAPIPDEGIAINYLKRNFAWAATHGQVEELVDLEGGWYDDPKLMACIGRLAEIMGDPQWDRTPVSQIALFVDETSFMYQAEHQANDLNGPLIFKSLLEYFHIGSPVDIYLLSDLTDGHVPLDRYKVIVLLNAFSLNSEQRAALKRTVQRDDRWVLSFYAPGFYTRDEARTEHMLEVTGIPLQLDVQPRKLTIRHDDRSYGTTAEISPVFLPDAMDTEVLARMEDGGDPAVVLKRMDGWTSVYSSVPVLPSSLLRQIAAEADVHLYSTADDLVYATQGLLAVHAGSDGVKRFNLPTTSTLHDPFSPTEDLTSTRELSVDMKKGDTRLWLLKPTNA